MEIMNDFIVEWFLIATLMLFASMAPGPAFILSVRQSMRYSRRAGFFTALGLGFGVAVHITYCIIGLSALIASSIMAFNILKYIGAAFLIYIGIKALSSHGFSNKISVEKTGGREDISAWSAWKTGFLTNVLNPKATMFFLALFTQMIDQNTPIFTKLIYGVTCCAIEIFWFSFVAFVLSSQSVRNAFLGVSKWVERLCGGFMIALGVRLAFSKMS